MILKIKFKTVLTRLTFKQMGYAQTSQRAAGIHTRQWSRAFIVQDVQGRRIVFVSAEIQAISDAMKRDVSENLPLIFSAIVIGNLFSGRR